jgi:hypothetical protein
MDLAEKLESAKYYYGALDAIPFPLLCGRVSEAFTFGEDIKCFKL